MEKHNAMGRNDMTGFNELKIWPPLIKQWKMFSSPQMLATLVYFKYVFVINIIGFSNFGVGSGI